MKPEISSEGLYADCGRHGSDAQADAYRLLFGQLYRVAYGMLRARPDGEALAADCAQAALIKIHRSLEQCREPATFRAWAAQIARRTVLDALRRPAQARHAPLDEHEAALATPPPEPASDLRGLLLDALRRGPLSERSRRVIAGRFFEERADEELAAEEARLAGEPVLPSHVQVTRAKNIAKLRRDAGLLERLRAEVG
jgi:RNA polymerase sigma factor (sigma-70 family)